MSSPPAHESPRPGPGQRLRSALAFWRQALLSGARLLVLAFTRSSYRGASRAAIARAIYLGSAPVLAWFTVLAAVISLVIIRIVIVTADSYGLSRYAVEMLVRVLVLELIPLAATVFAALYCAIPHAADIARLRASGQLQALARSGIDPLQREALPRALGALVAVLLLAAVAATVAALLSYLSMYGFTTRALPGFTREFGKIFDPAFATVFVLKTALLALAVALVPVLSALHDERPSRTGIELRSLVRLFAAILLIQAAALAGQYH